MATRFLLGLAALLALAACAPAAEFTGSAIPARVLDPWQTVADTLQDGDLAREWRFLGAAGDQAQVAVTSAAPLDIVLTDAAGAALAQGNPLAASLPADGSYRIVIAARAPADYTLRLTFGNRPTPTRTPTATLTPSSTFTASPTPLASDTPTATATPTATNTPTATPAPIYAPLGDLRGELIDGQPVTAAFISSFERHIYLFSGRAGQTACLALDGQGEVDAALTLFAPDGGVIAADDDSGGERDARLAGIRLETGGAYIVQVTSGGGIGPYTVRLSFGCDIAQPALVTPPPTATLAVGRVTPLPAGGPELADHAPLVGRLDAPGDVARYTVRLSGGEVITAVVQPVSGSPLRPRVQWVNPAGEVMLESPMSAEAGGALVPGLAVVEAGIYSLYISGDGQSFGDYLVAFGLGESHTDLLRGELPAQTDGALPQRGLRDVWSVALARGETVRVTLTPLVAGFAPSLALVSPGGEALAAAAAVRDAPNPAVEATAPVDGWYRVEITGGPALTYGAYRLEWTRAASGALPAPEAIAVLTAFDTLPPGEYRDYPFQGAAGERLRLRVAALTPGLDPVAALIAPDGGTLAEADDGPDGSLDPDLELVLPANGTYRWRVNGYNGAGGDLEVRVERLVGAAGGDG